MQTWEQPAAARWREMARPSPRLWGVDGGEGGVRDGGMGGGGERSEGVVECSGEWVSAVVGG